MTKEEEDALNDALIASMLAEEGYSPANIS
jgi:hypothetical protein